MFRYLERAGHVCRLLAAQFEAFEDSQIDEIDANWRRMYQAMGRRPFGGSFEIEGDDEDFMLTDSFTLADDWTFEPTNPDSIRSCIGAARENARQVRNVIGKDLWSCLNTAYLGIAELGIESIWDNQPREFYSSIRDMLRTVSGINDGTCYRDHGWHFMQLGRFVERSQLVASLLHAQLSLFSTANRNEESYWRSLLGSCEARVAYHRLYSLAYKPNQVVDFLVSDPLLSHSIRYSVSMIEQALDSASETQSLKVANPAKLRTAALLNQIDMQWISKESGDDATLGMLREIGDSCRELHDEIGTAYFYYDVESAIPA